MGLLYSLMAVDVHYPWMPTLSGILEGNQATGTSTCYGQTKGLACSVCHTLDHGDASKESGLTCPGQLDHSRVLTVKVEGPLKNDPSLMVYLFVKTLVHLLCLC